MADKKNKKKSLPIIITIISISIIVGLVGLYYISNQKKFDAKENVAEPTKNMNEESNAIKQKMAEKFTEAEEVFIKIIPKDYDKKKVAQKFEDLRNAAMNEKLDGNELREFQIAYTNYIADRKLTKDEVDRLLDLMDRAIIK